MVTIVNAQGDALASRVPRNDSGYVLDQQKLKDMPSGVYETEGYRERWQQSDHQVIRTYFCPWSQTCDFLEWLMGRSWSEMDPGSDPGKVATAVAFNASVPGPLDALNILLAPETAAQVTLPPLAGVLHRIIPAQDPQRPWLFAAEAELVEGKGAWVLDPGAYIYEPGGGVAFGPPDSKGVESPLTVPAIAFVDNDRGAKGCVVVSEEDDPPEVLLANRLAADGQFSDGGSTWRVTYKPREYTVLSDSDLAAKGTGELGRYVIRHEDYGLEALPLAKLAASSTAGSQLKFSAGPFSVAVLAGDAPPVPEAGVQQLPLATLNYTAVDWPDRPFGLYARTLGRVNADNFDGHAGSPVYPPGTLLMQPWRTKRTVTPTGRVSWQITHRLSFRPQGWNNFPAGDGKFYPVTWGGAVGGQPVYQSAQFTPLFTYPPPPVDYTR